MSPCSQIPAITFVSSLIITDKNDCQHFKNKTKVLGKPEFPFNILTRDVNSHVLKVDLST